MLVHTIGQHFGVTDPGEESWFIAGYSLTVGTFILFSGRLGDTFCHKKILVVGFAWFALWSVVAGCAAYSNHVLFDFARVLSGIGPALCLPNAIAILGNTYKPGKKKSMMFAVFGSMAPCVVLTAYMLQGSANTIPSIGTIVGATFAGIFDAKAYWPWSYWSIGITLAVAAVAAHFIIPDARRKTTARSCLCAKNFSTSSTSPEPYSVWWP